MATPKAAVEPSNKPLASICQLKGVSAGYEDEEILHNIDLYVGRGEIAALVGPNGAGKSTLLKVIAGFIKPTAGEVWFDGEEVSGLEPHARIQRGISYFMQGGSVFPDMTVEENLKVSALSVAPESREESVNKSLEVLPQLQGMRSTRAGLLSGGERQALALAMVAIKRSSLLLLDEPTAGLSHELAQETFQSIYNINHQWGTSVLLVEHNISEALKVADWVFVMEGGRILNQGPKAGFSDDRLPHPW